MKRRSVLALLVGGSVALTSSSVLATASQQMLLASGASAPAYGTAWTAIGNGITARHNHAGGGTLNSSLFFGGNVNGTITAAAESCNGATFTSQTAMATARFQLFGAGTSSSAALMWGGENDTSTDAYLTSASYNGSAWTAGGSLSVKRRLGASCGTDTAALSTGGLNPSSASTGCESYNGTTWSTGGSLTTATHSLSAFGLNTAAVACGGNTGSTQVLTAQIYNGSSWSSTGSLLVKRADSPGASGDQTAGLIFGGYNDVTGNLLTAEKYYNAVFVAGVSLPAALRTNVGCGISTSTLSAFGYDSSSSNAANKFI